MQSSGRHDRRSLSVTALAVTTLTALSLAAPTLGAAAHSGGSIQVFVRPNLSARGGGSILITGAIGDHGRGVKSSAAGQPDTSGRYVLAKLHRGTILLDTRGLNRAIAKGFDEASLDRATCSIHGSASATIKLVSGTRAYAGIGGTIHVRFAFAELAARYANGTRKGHCNLSAEPVAQWATVTGTGRVSFS